MRREIRLNENWLFHRGDIETPRPIRSGHAYSQSKTEQKKAGPAAKNYFDKVNPFSAVGMEMNVERWDNVTLPHDYIINGEFSEYECNAFGYLPYDNAWYRRHFTLKREGNENKRILLRFEGVASQATVYINGSTVYRNFSAYNTFEVDITDYVVFDTDNVIAVYVSTEEFEGWWYQGGGIYREVYLVVTDNIAIDLYGVYAPYKKIDQNKWQIDFETTVVNAEFYDKTVKAESVFIDKNGNEVLKADGTAVISKRDNGVIKYSSVIENPLLWDTENPNLYTVKTTLFADNAETDTDTTVIGFRTVEMSVENGLLINGKKTFINGMCAHQDCGLTGLAVPKSIAEYKVDLLKEMGANGFRTSHYQYSKEYMDAFDSKGILVMDEARWFHNTKESNECLISLVKRDRNRPSVIFWSTSNEEDGHITENGKKIHCAMAETIRKYDNTRYIVAAVSVSPEKATIFDDCDAVGINYNLGLYEEIHEKYPEKVLFASECCATGTTRDWYYPDSLNGRIRDLDKDTNNWFRGRENTYKFLRSLPYVIGCFQWAGFEHRGEAAWPTLCSKSGAIDLFLQKKGAFYQNKAHFDATPMVHIVSHWNFKGMDNNEITVPVYTNCEETELFLNGVSLGRQKTEKYGHNEWTVVYTAGTLTAKGYVNGKEAAADTRITTGRPYTMQLTLNNKFTADGSDIALFTCECLDENGNVVPDAAETVSFYVDSPAEIIATGSDNCDHIKLNSNTRKMYMGKISVAVRPQKNGKEFTLTAISDNCGTSQLKVKCE